MEKLENVYFMEHPLIQHKISMLRDKSTGTNEFRKLVEEIAVLMGYEALRDLPTEDVEVETPLEKCASPMISGKRRQVLIRGAKLPSAGDEVKSRPATQPE